MLGKRLKKILGAAIGTLLALGTIGMMTGCGDNDSASKEESIPEQLCAVHVDGGIFGSSGQSEKYS